MRKRLGAMLPGRKKWDPSDLTVYWCFFHTRREWSDEACPEPARWTLPDGTPLLPLVQAA